jgi:hypothetical protein
MIESHGTEAKTKPWKTREEEPVQGFDRKTSRKKPLSRPRREWEHIKMDFREIGLGGMDWFHLVDYSGLSGFWTLSMVHCSCSLESRTTDKVQKPGNPKWFHLAQDSYKQWALVNTVMNLRVT